MKLAEKQSEKRRAILDASLKLFCESCFYDTSTASISQAANVGTGTLFCYFDSKEHLVNELYLECKDEFASYIETGVWEHPTFKLQLKHIFERTVSWYTANPEKIKFMMQYCTSPLITGLTREKAVLRMSVVSDVVKKAFETGELTSGNRDLTAHAISAYFHQMSVYLQERAESHNLKKHQDEAFSLIWKGLN